MTGMHFHSISIAETPIIHAHYGAHTLLERWGGVIGYTGHLFKQRSTGQMCVLAHKHSRKTCYKW